MKHTETLTEAHPLRSSTQTTQERMNHFLEEISAYPEFHAQFLNTLSLLEYIGARKILKSQSAESISLEILTHTAEEVRHSQIFKRLAIKMSGGKIQTFAEDELFCGTQAVRYFQRIDQATATELKNSDPWTCYLITTLMIEERANLIYPFYETILARCGHPGILKAIVREEDHHLKDITTRIHQESLLSEGFLNHLRVIEEESFQAFLNHLTEELHRRKSHLSHETNRSTHLIMS